MCATKERHIRSEQRSRADLDFTGVQDGCIEVYEDVLSKLDIRTVVDSYWRLDLTKRTIEGSANLSDNPGPFNRSIRTHGSLVNNSSSSSSVAAGGGSGVLSSTMLECYLVI
jgi:hypothetical protein